MIGKSVLPALKMSEIVCALAPSLAVKSNGPKRPGPWHGEAGVLIAFDLDGSKIVCRVRRIRCQVHRVFKSGPNQFHTVAWTDNNRRAFSDNELIGIAWRRGRRCGDLFLRRGGISFAHGYLGQAA